MSTAYDAHVSRLQNAWRTEDDDDEHRREIVPDGGRVRVSILTMDAVQQQIAGQTAVDQRVVDNLVAGQALLDAARRDADRVQAHADHFTEQRALREREARDENPAYARYSRELADAWQQVAP